MNNLQIAYENLKARDFMPVVPFVQISQQCNLRCRMCGHRDWSHTDGLMEQSLFEHVLEQIRDVGASAVCLANAQGEPFMHPAAMDMMEAAVRSGFNVIISTNGTLLDEQRITRLAGMGLHSIQFSFAGYDRRSYETVYCGGKFDTVARNLGLLRDMFTSPGHPTTIMVNGVAHSQEEMDKTREFLLNMRIPESWLSLKFPCNFAGKYATSGVRADGRHASEDNSRELTLCRVLTDNPGIYHDGRVTACGCLDSEGRLAIGDITRQSLRDIRQGKAYLRIVEAFRLGRLEGIPLCSCCDIPYVAKAPVAG